MMTAITQPALPPPLGGVLPPIRTEALGSIAWYGDASSTAVDATPLLLIHSVNAAASAYEVRPLYDHYRRERPTYALDLPGYGLSSRESRDYVPRLMTDAIHAVILEISRRHPGRPIDALALSLSCEFLARAATESPAAFRSVALVSPTGFRGRRLRLGATGADLGRRGLLRWLLARGRGRWIFRQLTRPRVIRYFLRRTWGSTRIDTGLLEYDVLTARAEGAEFAPLHFLSGCLFAADSGRLYQALSMPVWAAHGVRGDFTNYDALSQVVGSRPWTVEVFPTGALPHFEVPVDFRRRYDSFIQLVRGPAGVAS